MEVLYLLTTLINAIFIKSLFISVLSIVIVGKVLKTDTRTAFAIIKWLILVYAVLNIVYSFMAYLYPATMIISWDKATGSYDFAYYLMIVPNTLLPLLLFVKKLGRNKYVLLSLSFLMNIGWEFELLIMYYTDLHRQYIHNKFSFNFLWFIALQGLFIGSIIYAIGNVIKRKVPSQI